MAKVKLVTLHVSYEYNKYSSRETQVTDSELADMHTLLENLQKLSYLKIEVDSINTVYLYPNQLKKAIAGISVREVEIKDEKDEETQDGRE